MDDKIIIEEEKNEKTVPVDEIDEVKKEEVGQAADPILLETFEKRIEELKKEVEDEKNAKLRYAADCKNITMRANKEKEELLKFAQNALLAKLLDFTNDFKNIVESETFIASKEDPWFHGVEIVYDKLFEIVNSEGIMVIDAKEGMPFNAQFHEAIGFITVTDESENQKIAKVASLGYKRVDSDKVVLPTRVIVNRKN